MNNWKWAHPTLTPKGRESEASGDGSRLTHVLTRSRKGRQIPASTAEKQKQNLKELAMGEWITGAAINILGSIGINFGTNLLKLGHNQREKLAASEAAAGVKAVSQKPIIHFQSWWIGIIVFIFGNILNFISFGYAAQSLLAALGSIQFVSNVGFTYFVLKEKVTGRKIAATLFIVAGNIFLVAFGNHQSKVYTQEELFENYGNRVYLIYCICLIILVSVNHIAYKKGRVIMSSDAEKLVSSYWPTLLPFSYAMVSGIIGSHSVLFAKLLSLLLRQTMSGDNELDGWFTYAILLLFICTASFWMARLNDGLAMFDAILIIPMLQIVWTFFSIFTGFVYFAEYQVFDSFRTSIFVLGILTLFVGILMLAPDVPEGLKAGSWLDPEESLPLIKVQEQSHPSVVEQQDNPRDSSFIQYCLRIASAIIVKAKTACRLSFGLVDNRSHVTSVFAMPMLASSRMAWRNPLAKCNTAPMSILEVEELETVDDAN